MDATDVREPDIASDLADLRSVALADMPVLDTSIIDGALRRLVPESVTKPVPVSTFNSAI